MNIVNYSPPCLFTFFMAFENPASDTRGSRGQNPVLKLLWASLKTSFNVTSHLRWCPSAKKSYARQFRYNPNKVYIMRKLNKCTLRKRYNFKDVFFQDVSGAGKAWNDRGFFYWIYRLAHSTVRAKWVHSLINKASINERVSGFLDILIGCLDIHI